MRSGQRFSVCVTLAGAATLVACTSSLDATDPNAPMDLAIFVNPPSLSVGVADTITTSDNVKLLLTATSLGFPVVTPRAEWTTSDPKVAVVDSNGLVRVVGLGPATITARVNGEKAHTQLSVVRRVVAVRVTPASTSGTVGDSVTITANAVDAGGFTVAGTAYSFASADPTIASVARTGNLTAQVRMLKPGTTFINVSAGGQIGTAQVTVH
jgi:uncharacterized protein YjdB